MWFCAETPNSGHHNKHHQVPSLTPHRSLSAFTFLLFLLVSPSLPGETPNTRDLCHQLSNSSNAISTRAPPVGIPPELAVVLCQCIDLLLCFHMLAYQKLKVSYNSSKDGSLNFLYFLLPSLSIPDLISNTQKPQFKDESCSFQDDAEWPTTVTTKEIGPIPKLIVTAGNILEVRIQDPTWCFQVSGVHLCDQCLKKS